VVKLYKKASVILLQNIYNLGILQKLLEHYNGCLKISNISHMIHTSDKFLNVKLYKTSYTIEHLEKLKYLYSLNNI